MQLLTWPTFAERYESVPITSAPAYWDSLIVVVLLLLSVMATLYTVMGAKGRMQALQLVTLRPRNIRSVSEYTPRPIILAMGILVGSVLVGILVTLLLRQTMGDALSAARFWDETLRHSLYAFGLFSLSLLLQFWISFSFGDSDELRLWLPGYVFLSAWWASMQLLPLLVLLFLPHHRQAVSIMIGLLYFIYRVWVVWRGVTVLSRVRRHPLHIIWYLCGCELLPLLLLTNAVAG